jgi:pimeloyl-ACP methyl ester carboxylesterase
MRRFRRPVIMLALSLFCLAGAISCSSTPATTGKPAASATATTKPAAASTVWLCRPGQTPDPCTSSLSTTVLTGTGHRQVVDYPQASNPGIDCFYLYPRITLQTTPNANLAIDPQETAIAELEASPFSRDCRVFAPMYRQVTAEYTTSTSALQVENASVLAAWNDYLAHYNDGRGVVLIGHSEGADALAELIATQVNPDASVRQRLVSAILTGANLAVSPQGNGPFSQISACRTVSQTGCVVAYNAFSGPVPRDALFGWPSPTAMSQGLRELCTNPAALGGGSAILESQYRVQLPTQQVSGSTKEGVIAHYPAVSTPWLQYDDQYQASCVASGVSAVLVVKPVNGGSPLLTVPNAAWGLHVDDPNLALGNLVALVQSQAEVYLKAHPAS